MQLQLDTKPSPYFILTASESANMDWKGFQSSFGNINLSATGNRISKGFNSSIQATRERLGTVAPEEITELPQGMFIHCLWLGF